MSYTRRLEIFPGFNCRDACAHGSPTCKPGAGGFHGVTTADIHASVSTNEGAMSFTLMTGWVPLDEWKGRTQWGTPRPCPSGVHWHFPVDDPGIGRECHLVSTGRCVGDTGFLMADIAMEVMVAGGSEALFSLLEGYHADTDWDRVEEWMT